MTRRRPQGAQRADRPARDERRRRPRRDPRAHDRRQPDHASPRARHRPDPARLGAVRARDRPGGRRSGPRSWSSRVHPGARVYVLPCIAGHVGADTAGRDPRRGAPPERGRRARRRRRHERRDRPRQPLLPARRVVADRAGVRGRPDQRRPACRAGRDRAGPDRPRDARAAVPGHRRRAVVRRARASPRPTAATGVTGHLRLRASSRSIAELFLAGVITPDGIVDGSLAARTPRIVPDGRTFSYLLHDGSAEGRPRIVITQNDVRAIQLAKAALYAGVRLLMDHAGIETVDEIRLAGAFGSQIDTFHAMVLGLIPDAQLSHVKAAGNAAGTGRADRARSARAARREIEGVVADRREDRDRGRAALPGALRRRDGVPPPDRAVPEPVGRRRPAPTDRRRRKRRPRGRASTTPSRRADRNA